MNVIREHIYLFHLPKTRDLNKPENKLSNYTELYTDLTCVIQLRVKGE